MRTRIRHWRAAPKAKAPAVELADQLFARLCVSLCREKEDQVRELEALGALMDTRKETE